MLAEVRHYQGMIYVLKVVYLQRRDTIIWLPAMALKREERASWTQITCMDTRGSKTTSEGLLTLGAEPNVVDQRRG